jgi:hypothetical protein
VELVNAGLADDIAAGVLADHVARHPMPEHDRASRTRQLDRRLLPQLVHHTPSICPGLSLEHDMRTPSGEGRGVLTAIVAPPILEPLSVRQPTTHACLPLRIQLRR